MSEKQVIVLASGNAHKIREISDMLPEFKVVGYKEMGFNEEIVEDGLTFYENALIKAKTVSKALNLPALADDSGISVEAMGGGPGVYSARYAGEKCTPKDNRVKMLKFLEGVTNRKAKFVCAICYIDEEGKARFFRGETEGEILLEEDGDPSFGYDCIFYSYDLKQSFGRAKEEDKNKSFP